MLRKGPGEEQFEGQLIRALRGAIKYVSGIDTSNVDGPHSAPLGVGLGRGIYPQFQKTKLEHLPGFGRAVGACARVYVTSAAEPQ